MPENLNTQWKQVGRPKKIQTYPSVNVDKVAKSTFPFPPPLPSSHLHLLRTQLETLIPIPILSFPPKKCFPSSSSLPRLHSFRQPPPTPFSLSFSPSLTKIPHQKLPSPSIVFVFSGLVRESSGVLDICPRGHGHGHGSGRGRGRGPLCGRKIVTCLEVFVVF